MPVVVDDVEVSQPAPGGTHSSGDNPSPIAARTVERLVDRIDARRARLVAD